MKNIVFNKIDFIYFLFYFFIMNFNNTYTSLFLNCVGVSGYIYTMNKMLTSGLKPNDPLLPRKSLLFTIPLMMCTNLMIVRKNDLDLIFKK